jgi:hypothetical protein
MTTRKLPGTYRGFSLFEVLDEQGHPTGEVVVEGLAGQVFASLLKAQAAIDTHLDQEAAPKTPSYRSPRP